MQAKNFRTFLFPTAFCRKENNTFLILGYCLVFVPNNRELARRKHSQRNACSKIAQAVEEKCFGTKGGSAWWEDGQGKRIETAEWGSMWLFNIMQSLYSLPTGFDALKRRNRV